MPGILGIIRPEPFEPDITSILDRMAEPLRYAPDQTVQHFEKGRFAGSVVDYGPGFGFLKPAAAERDGVLLLMDGEVFPDAGEVPHELVGTCPTIQRADYCLHLYLEHGPPFISYLDGTFAIAVVDSRDRKVHLYTDRFCSRPLYVWTKASTTAFGTSVRSLLLMSNDIGGEYDRQALAELVVFERVFGNRTLFTDIQRLPAAAQAIWDGQALVIQQYLNPLRAPSDVRYRSWHEASDDLSYRLRNAIQRRTADGARTATFISGGIDSRLVLALSPPHIEAVTFANANCFCRETSTALTIARALNRPCLLLERKSDYYALHAQRMADICEGLVVFGGAHTVGINPAMWQTGIRVVMTAMFFDSAFKGFFGTETTPRSIYDTPPEEFMCRRDARLLADSSLVRRADRYDLAILVLADEMKNIASVARERRVRWLATLRQQLGSIAELKDKSCFAELQSAGGFVGFLYGIRMHFVDRSPVYDNDVVQLALNVPHAWKLKGRLVRRAIMKTSRKLGWIQDNNFGIPAGLCSPWHEMATFGNRYVAGGWRHLRRKFYAAQEPSSVFTSGAWHNLNAALRCSNLYRKLVEDSIEVLPTEMFDVHMVRALMKHDLLGKEPQMSALWVVLITFALFHKAWGPGGSRRVATSLSAN
ncbi:MAG: hypothetical protein GXY44_08445 [Phycisphaerales bacterium]|nr:hypothetical protein [Phycisphaerales bacterium]